jgi:hypothetical protein
MTETVLKRRSKQHLLDAGYIGLFRRGLTFIRANPQELNCGTEIRLLLAQRWPDMRVELLNIELSAQTGRGLNRRDDGSFLAGVLKRALSSKSLRSLTDVSFHSQ